MTTALRKVGILESEVVSPLEDIFHKVDDTPGHHDANPIEPTYGNKSIYRGVDKTGLTKQTQKACVNCSTIQEIVERKRRDVDIPFSYVGGGFTFNQEAFDEVSQIREVDTNCF